MSRSYKKASYCGDKKGKWKKRIANHKVRQYLKRHPEVNVCGKAYKKIYESYEICDYCFFETWEEYWNSCLTAIREYQTDIERVKGYKDTDEQIQNILYLYKCDTAAQYKEKWINYYNRKIERLQDKKYWYRKWYKTYKMK